VAERKTGFIKSGEMPLFCVFRMKVREDLRFGGRDRNELTIDCPQCENGTFRFYNGRWGDFSFRLEH